jgi:arabinogalactan endo-1,4-beta-galactosidase
MKTFYYLIVILCIVQIANAQNIGFRSNGHINNFKKIDTLFFHEYAGQKPSTKTADIDTTFSKQLMQQSKKSFGFITKDMAEFDQIKTKFGNWKKKFTTSFYAYSDGTLQAPTDVLFFKPINEATVFTDFVKYGTVEAHETLYFH